MEATLISWIEWARRDEDEVERRQGNMRASRYNDISATIVCSFKQIREYKCLFIQLSSILFFSWYCLPFLSLDSDSKEFVFGGEKRDILIKCRERMERKIASFRFDSGIYIYLFIATFEYSSLGCRTHTNTQPHTHKPSVYGNIYSIW